MPVKKPALIFTGGHHTGALPVAIGLKSEGYEIIWFGHLRSLWGDDFDSAEYREVIGHKIQFHDLQAGKFHHTVNPFKLIRIPWGFVRAFWLIISLRPKYDIRGIVSFGGYLALPTVVSGWILGIPSLTHEQTTVSGWANRLISFFASKIAVTWSESTHFFPKSKVVVTGLPLRPEILDIKKKSPGSKRHSLRTVYITGGKNGSRVINRVVFAALPRLITKYRVIHQTGFKDLATAKSFQHSGYEPFDYSSREAFSALSKADVVVGRSGAHTVYELGVLGIPSVLIPIPWVSHKEQEKNAELLASRGLAVILNQLDMTPNTLIKSIEMASSMRRQPLPLPENGLENLVHLIKQEFSL